RDRDLKAPDSVVEAALFAGDASELKMRIRLAGIDRHGLSESGNRFAVLPPLLMNEAELIMRVSVARIVGGDFELFAQALARTQSLTERANIGAQDQVGVVEHEWRHEEAE